MKIFKSSEVAEIDAYTIKNEPIASIDLMERASNKIFEWLSEKYLVGTEFVIFAGPGNNGGDALAVGRMLFNAGYSVEVCLVKVSESYSDDFQINIERLTKIGSVRISEINSSSDLPSLQQGQVVLDGIFGSGLKRSLNGVALDVVHEINKSECEVVAIDIPSGLFGEDNSGNSIDDVIHAHYTLALEFPSLSFFFAENEISVGEWCVLPIGLHDGIIDSKETAIYNITKDYVLSNLKKRSRFSHKGTYGHALFIAGSFGKIGASILGASACLKTGVGLLTVQIPKCGYVSMQTAVPEAMTIIDADEKYFTIDPILDGFDAIAVGPGIGRHVWTDKALKQLIEKSVMPIIFDADAINILSEHKEWYDHIPQGSIFTPHPKEFERLVGSFKDGYSRMMAQIDFAKQYNVVLVVKGANTSVTCPDGSVWFNTTGNPGMATAGCGDVLAGMMLSLKAQGYSSEETAKLAVFIHGLAGDLAVEDISEEALTAGELVSYIGDSFINIRR